MNVIWLGMIIAGVVVAALRNGGDVSGVTDAVVNGSAEAVKLAFSLVGILAFWSGMMRLAEDAGMTQALGRLLSPVVRRLFPSVPPTHPALGAILLSFSANMLGLGNAATPLGIRAMEELQKLNRCKDTASDAMCTFVAICASGLTLVPSTVIALRAAAHSQDPTSVVGPTLFATACAACGALVADRVLRNHRHVPPPSQPPARPQERSRATVMQTGGAAVAHYSARASHTIAHRMAATTPTKAGAHHGR